jgi:hypothetical protein
VNEFAVMAGQDRVLCVQPHEEHELKEPKETMSVMIDHQLRGKKRYQALLVKIETVAVCMVLAFALALERSNKTNRLIMFDQSQAAARVRFFLQPPM